MDMFCRTLQQFITMLYHPKVSTMLCYSKVSTMLCYSKVSTILCYSEVSTMLSLFALLSQVWVRMVPTTSSGR